MEIEFTPENIEKCLCSQCNVQGKSKCVKDKMITLQERALSSSIIEPEEFPALYCASGKEHCSDLDENKRCMCPDCPIYLENDFGSGIPENYFCLNGQSLGCYLCKLDNENAGRVAEMLRHYYRRTD